MRGTSACQSFIGKRGPCFWGRRLHRTAAPYRQSRGGRTPPLGSLRCFSFWASHGAQPQARALGPLPAGSRGAPTVLPSEKSNAGKSNVALYWRN